MKHDFNAPIRALHRKYIPPVTILIGFANKENVVFASDSQSSSPSSTAKQQDVQKISSARLSNGKPVLIAKAGGLDSADYFLEIFETRAAVTPIVDKRTVADLAEVCLMEVQAKLLEPLRDRGASGEEINQYLRDYSCELLIGYIYEGKPLIYKLRSDSCLAVRDKHAFVALGCAANLATSVLSGFDLSEVTFIQSMGIAGYAVEVCKLNDWACSGRTQIAAISPSVEGESDDPFFAEQSTSEMVEDSAKEIHRTMQKTLRESALETMTSRLAKAYAEVQAHRKSKGD